MPLSSRSERPVLLLSEIDDFDPSGPQGRKWCPLCGRDKPRDAAHRCLSVDRASGRWHCFRCGEGGVAREFWTLRNQESVSQRRLDARNRALQSAFSLGDETSKGVSCVPELNPAFSAPESWLDWWNETGTLEESEGAFYLQKRAISLECALLSGVRFHPSWCCGPAVVFPVGDQEGRLVAAQGRATAGRAKITRGPKKQGAFCAVARANSPHGFHPLRARLDFVVVVEAPIDALSLATCGVPAIALCGTSGPSWLHRVCAFKRVFLGLDADDAGDFAARTIESHISCFGARVSRFRPEGAKDWNELLLLEGKEPLGDWLCSQILA